MKITADTNVLVRAVVRDDPKQSSLAIELLQDAQIIAVPLPVLCELAWVLKSVYGFGKLEVAAAIEKLIRATNVVTDKSAADAGLEVLRGGGDFPDGAIAYAGRWLGGQTFVSFDKKAVAILVAQGQDARLL